ncbi:hypothetical protein HUG17_1487 [Dermatophagoides farinae]|uniref:Uncharacterized protein n=1 Tax=Dermatophagoides farinae TaxID=6954 RepID=A0A9D4P9D8_DERFA|nr:hypothetical protein HUG17_1487 [Dermatophagoides farinae]
MRLKQRNIFMVMLVNRKDMKDAGYDLNDIFKPVVNDLKRAMSEGYNTAFQTRSFICRVCGAQVQYQAVN